MVVPFYRQFIIIQINKQFIMKYETEINEMLKIAIPKESWMSDDEYKEIIDNTFKKAGITKQRLSEVIQTGVKNGYTVDQQINILKLTLNGS